MDQLKGVKGWLDSINIVYYEGTPNLSWNQDVAGFHKDWLVFLAKMDSVGEFKPTESEDLQEEVAKRKRDVETHSLALENVQE
ncbi:989_t:CDS:2 [Entrophospora sp. SA101]|nr:989_t:CDS:2 [Entrophospora sp. SA101]